MAHVKVRGVLFDSGDTLIRPIGGRWNPRFDFEQIVLRHHPNIQPGDFHEAFAAGQRFLETAASTSDRADYHRSVLRPLGVTQPSPALLAELDEPLLVPPVEPFPEVPQVLEGLKAHGMRMAIVSDNWPGLEDLYRDLGLYAFFELFVISAVLGCAKPDPRMYRTASDGLGLRPQECVFVDDVPRFVAAAIDLGYHGVTIHRTTDPPRSVPSIPTLDELIPMICT